METSIITIKYLVNEAQCYATIRRGYRNPQRVCQRYQYKACGKCFDDLTGTVLSGHHQPLSV